MSSNSTSSASVLNNYQHVQRLDESVFLTLQVVGGQVLLPILVLTILLSRKVTRNVVFVNFCVSWIISSIVYSLLVYRGRSSDDLLSLNPSSDSCLVQASLINGVQAFTSVSYVSLVTYLWVVLNGNSEKPSVYKRVLSHEILFPCFLVTIPFAAFVAFVVVSIVIGSPLAINEQTGQPFPGTNLAIPGVFYCIILQNGDFSTSITSGLKFLQTTYIFSVVMTFFTFTIEILIVLLVYKKRFALQTCVKGHSAAWTSLFLRIVIFGVYRLVALGLNLALIIKPDEILLTGISKDTIFNGVIDFIQATIPLVAFIVFATERDVLNVWMFWKRKSPLRNKNNGTDTKVVGTSSELSA